MENQQHPTACAPRVRRSTPKDPAKLKPVEPHAHDEQHLHSHAGDQAYGPTGD